MSKGTFDLPKHYRKGRHGGGSNSDLLTALTQTGPMIAGAGTGLGTFLLGETLRNNPVGVMGGTLILSAVVGLGSSFVGANVNTKNIWNQLKKTTVLQDGAGSAAGAGAGVLVGIAVTRASAASELTPVVLALSSGAGSYLGTALFSYYDVTV